MKRFRWKFWLSCALAFVVCRWIALSISSALAPKAPGAHRPTAEVPLTAPAPASSAPSAPVAPGLQFDPSTATLEPSPASPTQSPASQPAQ